MILFHISNYENRPVLWAERSADEQVKKTTSGKQTRRSNKSKIFPYDAGEDGLQLLHQRWSDAIPPIGCTSKVVAWLPSLAGRRGGKNNGSLASSALIQPQPVSVLKTHIMPWQVTVSELSWNDLVHLLCFCEDKSTPVPGILIGPDIVFWKDAMRFAGSLCAREQFLPGIRAENKSFQAQWQPVFLGEDKERYAFLMNVIPPVVHALTGLDQESPPKTVRKDLLTQIVTGFMDYLIRSSISADRSMSRQNFTERAADHDILHDQWLNALRTSDGELHGKAKVLAKLVQQVEEYRQPLDRLSASPYRLCFRLHEPPDLQSAGNDALPVQQAGRKADDEAWRVEYLLQQHDDKSLLLPVSQLWNTKNVLPSKSADSGAREFLLSSLGQAAGLSPDVEESLKHSSPSGYVLDIVRAHEFLTQTSLIFDQAGFGVFLPAWWTRKGTKLRPAVHANVKSPSMQASGSLSLDTIVNFNWNIALGDEVLTREELDYLARLKAPLVKLRGQWVELNAEEIRAAIEFWKKQPTESVSVREIIRMKLGSGAPVHGLQFSGVTASGWIGELMQKLEGGAAYEEISPPSKFSGELRPYQVRGYSWMTYLKSWGLGACLADDMGLGKTVQTLALILRDWNSENRRPVLLVCPASVVNNWRKEASRFTPDLPVMVHHGADRKKGKAFNDEVSKHAIVVSTYALLHRDQKHLQEVDWGGIVLDESQNIKNSETKQSRSARALKAGYRLALTGTPVENHVGDLWSLMEFLNPGFLGTHAEFKRKFFVPIHAGTDPNAAVRLRSMTGPFILRRLKTDKSIISDLPEKMEMKTYCTLTKEQASLYASVLKDIEDRIGSSDGIERKGLILATLSKLKQVCNHPAHFLGDNSSVPGRSGKVTRLSEMVEEIIDAGEKALVFTQFAEMGGILKKHLQETFGREIFFLHGAVPIKQRSQMVDRFQNERNASPVFILSLKAGGTGLNLTQGNHVFHFDRWWNPAVENQATDRAFRIGQTKNVHVYKFICAGTLEDKIDEMIERKKGIADKIVGAGEGWLTELSNKALKELFMLRKDMVGE